MEIYTGDLIEMAISYAERICTKIDYHGYVVEDECNNLQRAIRNTVYNRLQKAFTELVDREIQNDSDKVHLKNELFKIINDL